MAATGRSLIDAWLLHGAPEAADDAAVYFLQGDYLHLPSSDIAGAINLAKDMTGGRIRTLFSTSLVMKTTQVEEKLDLFIEAARQAEQEIAFTIILNPAWMSQPRLRTLYERNIAVLRSRIPLDEAGFNIGPGLAAQASPEAVDNFFVENGFADVDIALLPLRSNAAGFAAEWPEIISWLDRFFALSRKHGHYEAIFPALAAEHLRHWHDSDFSDVMEATARKVAWEIFLDLDGRASALQTGGFANVVPLSDRFGFEEGEDIPRNGLPATTWQARARQTARRIHTPGLTDAICSACEFRTTCALAGSAIIRQAMKHQDIATPDCPLGIKALFAGAKKDNMTGRGGRTLFGVRGANSEA